MADNVPKQEAERGENATPKNTTENSANELPLFFEKHGERFYALLPSGKRPEIRPIRPPGKLRDIIAAHRRPQIPMVAVQPQSVTSIAQLFPNPQDPTYISELLQWRQNYMAAMMMRCLFDGLVVPEDDEWAWLLEMTDVQVPQDGPERVRLYAQERHPEFWDADKPNEAAAFVAAIQQITMPSEAGIAIARRQFRDEVAEDVGDEPQSPSGRISGQSSKGGTEDRPDILHDTG